jgi:hypothetical protein
MQVEAEKREIETEEHLKIMADKEIVSLPAAALSRFVQQEQQPVQQPVQQQPAQQQQQPIL